MNRISCEGWYVWFNCFCDILISKSLKVLCYSELRFVVVNRKIIKNESAFEYTNGLCRVVSNQQLVWILQKIIFYHLGFIYGAPMENSMSMRKSFTFMRSSSKEWKPKFPDSRNQNLQWNPHCQFRIDRFRFFRPDIESPHSWR